MPFKVGVGGGDIKDIFVTEYDVINNMTGHELWFLGGARGIAGDNIVNYSILSSPVQTISGGTNWKSLATGSFSSHMAAIKTDGTLWLWGAGRVGALGNNKGAYGGQQGGNYYDQSSPVQTVSGGTNWKQVSVYGGCFDGITGAIKTDGTLWMWGNSNYGKLGNNTNFNACRSSPVQTVAGGTNWSQLSVGGTAVAAIKTDGTLWIWGHGCCQGIMGDNSSISKSSPVQVIGNATNWKSVNVGTRTAAAIKTDGTLWLWGYAGCGRLGNNTGAVGAPNQSSPVQTVAGGTNWKQVILTGESTAAIKTDGTLWVWGCERNGGLGINTRLSLRSSPVQTIAGGSNWKQISTGSTRYSMLAMKTDGTVWGWGSNATYTPPALGNRSSPVQNFGGITNWRSVRGSLSGSFALRLFNGYDF